MSVVEHHGRTWVVGLRGFLKDHENWDEAFAEAMAARVRIPDGLTDDHWRTIRFIRERFEATGKCPHACETCRANGLSLKDMKRLFPTGYQRGACKLAGVTYSEGNQTVSRPEAARARREGRSEEESYRVDAQGFLLDPDEWDVGVAVGKAQEMGMTENLSRRHWKVISFLRRFHRRVGRVPTVYETCELNEIDIRDLELLFPQGYHRGAVKIAGLRVL